MKSKGLSNAANVMAYDMEHKAILAAILEKDSKAAWKESKRHLHDAEEEFVLERLRRPSAARREPRRAEALAAAARSAGESPAERGELAAA